MRAIPLLVILVLYGLPSAAQNVEQQRINRLTKRLNTLAKNDSNNLGVLDSLAFEYKSIDPQKGIDYGQQELSLAVKLDKKTDIALANISIGLNYEYKSQYPEALEYYYTALTTFEKYNDKKNIATTQNRIGNIFDAEQNHANALEAYNKSMQIDSSLHNMNNYAGDLGNIGNQYMNLGDLDRALEYDLRSLTIFRSLGDSGGVAYNLGNIGNIYKTKRQYARALEYDKMAIALFEKEGDNPSIALNEGNIGDIYLDAARDTTGKVNFKDIGVRNKAACVGNAITYFTKCIILSRSIGDMQDVMEYSMGLSSAYELKGDYKAALAAYKQFTSAKDSVFSTESKEKVAILNAQREIEIKSKQQKIDALQVTHRRYRDEFYLILIAVFVLLFGIFMKKIFPKLF